MARFCYRHRARLALVSKLHPDANLFDPPYTGKGRTRLNGHRRLKPRQAAGAAESFARLEVGWYGGASGGSSRHKRVFGQRWQVESTFSRHKRRLGSAVAARSDESRTRECFLRVLTHKLMLLAATG